MVNRLLLKLGPVAESSSCRLPKRQRGARGFDGVSTFPSRRRKRNWNSVIERIQCRPVRDVTKQELKLDWHMTRFQLPLYVGHYAT